LSISRTVESDTNTTVFRVTGEADVDRIVTEIIEFLVTAPTRLAIWDLSDASLRGMNASDLREIVRRAGPFTGSRAGGRTAIITGNDLDFGLSRMFATFADLHEIPFEICVFRDSQSARAWLSELVE
jgi:hypothetical protein